VAPKDVLERCIALRISGRAEVRSGHKRAQVDLLGGDVVGIDGVDPEQLIEWRAGSFRVLQSLPDFDGRLTDERERRGLLAEIDSSRLFAWAQQHQLSVTVELQSGARHALVEVENGRIINATEGGRPASASQMQGWRTGTYCVSLLPLFPEQSVRISVAPLPEIVVAKGTGSHSAVKGTNGHTNGTEPHARVELTPPPGVLMGDAMLPSQKKNRVMRAVVAGGLVVGAAGLILILTGKNGPKAPPAAAAAAGAEPDKADPAKADPAKADPAKADPAKGETAKAETPKPEAAEPKKPSDADKTEATRLAQQAQGLLLTGKRSAAMPLLDKAQKLDPENALAKTAVAQARGDAGVGMLVVASKPRADKVIIDGTPMGKTPLKLKKIPAGAHTVQVGSAQPQDVEVPKGKKKVVLFKLGKK
jgi:hypothetical protein